MRLITDRVPERISAVRIDADQADIYVLANDGSLWCLHDSFEGCEWERLPDLPQPDDK